MPLAKLKVRLLNKIWQTDSKMKVYILTVLTLCQEPKSALMGYWDGLLPDGEYV